MNDTKYIGLGVPQAKTSMAVLDSAGKLVMEAIIETKAETILQSIRGLRGSLHVTLKSFRTPRKPASRSFRGYKMHTLPSCSCKVPNPSVW